VGRAEGEKMKPIEERIRPLVDAINDVGYFKTFSNCEGHFGLRDSHRYDNREKAEVRLHELQGIEETAIETFFAAILKEYVSSPVQRKVTLDICKRYTPNDDGRIEYAYIFTLKPFDPHEADELKQKHVDELIEPVTKAVRHYPII
jgi:hypothetical protein